MYDDVTCACEPEAGSISSCTTFNMKFDDTRTAPIICIFSSKVRMHACMRHVLAYTSSHNLRNTTLAGVERGWGRGREEEGGRGRKDVLGFLCHRMLLDAFSHPLRFGKQRLLLNLSLGLFVTRELELGLDDFNPSSDFVALVQGTHVILSVEVLYFL